MGSYSSFRIAGRELYSVKNDIDPLLMSLFRPEDKIVEPGTYSAGRGYAQSEQEPSDPEDLVDTVQYVSTVGVLRDRLDLMGFTLRYAKIEFDRGLEEDINKTEGWAATEPSEDFRNACAERLLVLRSLTFES